MQKDVQQKIIDNFFLKFEDGLQKAGIDSSLVERHKPELKKITDDLADTLQSEVLKDYKNKRWLRNSITITLLVLFVLLNIWMAYLIYTQVNFDNSCILAGKCSSDDRVIDTSVFIAGITAIVAEAAGAFILVVKYLFPNGVSEDSAG